MKVYKNMKALRFLGVLLILLSLRASQCFSQVPPTKPGEIIIAGEVVMRIRAPAGGMSIEERTNRVWERLVEAMAHPEWTYDIRMEKQAGEWCIFIGQVLIITVDKETAQLNKTTQDKLAAKWTDNLKKYYPLGVPHFCQTEN